MKDDVVDADVGDGVNGDEDDEGLMIMYVHDAVADDTR